LFDDNCLAAAAIDAPHRVKQKNQKAPKRNELEPTLGKLIVSGGGLMAARTDRRRALAGTHDDLDALMIETEAGLRVNESRKTVTAV
jgi:hypothetical protein